MLRIRLQRKGRKKRPIWHIVVADSRAPRDGRIIEQLGRYDNVTEKKEVILNEDRVFYWLDNGAQPSDSVRKILRNEGLLYKRHLIGWGKSEEEVETALSEWKSYRDSKDSSETSRKAQYQSILDAEEKEYKKQVQEKSKQAAAEVEAEKAQEEAAAETEASTETEEATAEQGDTSATVDKEATAENKAAKAAESQTEDETVQAKGEPAEKAAAESDATPVATEDTTEIAEEKTEETGATAEEAAEEVREEVSAVSEAPDTASVKEEDDAEAKSEEPADKEESKEETKSESESSDNVSTNMTAKEAIDHINNNSIADLEGFVTGDEDRVTVQRAWESKQEEG